MKLLRRNNVINLETQRLKLLPLQADNLALSLDNYGEMESDLGLMVTNTVLDDEMKYAMKVRLRKVLEDVENYLWLTNWAIVLKKEKRIIGFIMIKGYPNENGEVIVGYSIEKEYRKMGYATEALKRLIKWIFKNPKVVCVIGDTERENTSSHKVLENVGAVKYKETSELMWWKIESRS